MTDLTLTTLEALILALVERGWNTPYKLKESAGISVGAALPALARLQGRSLVQRAAVAARRKQEFELTPFGKKALVKETKRMIKEASESAVADTESALRLAALAFFNNRRSAAVSLLQKAGETRHRLSKFKSDEGQRLVATDLASFYKTMAQACEVTRMEAEGAALTALARKLRQTKVTEKP